jgi:ABC-type dipeptide/oligopeptide/nickel transport system permease component
MAPAVSYARSAAQIIAAVMLVWGATFLALRALTPDPSATIAGIRSDDTTRRAISEQFGLDLPAPVALAESYGRALRLDFGHSIRSGRPVTELIGPPLRLTITVSLLVALLSVVAFAVALVLPSVVTRRSAWTVAIAALPGFLLALMLAPWFISTSEVLCAEKILWQHLLLPILALLTPFLPQALLNATSARVDIERAPWYRTYLHCGQSALKTRLWHGRWLLLSRASLVAIYAFVVSFVGSVGVEQVTGLPGLGLTMLDAINGRDAPVVLAVSGISSALTAVLLACARGIESDGGRL